MKNNNKGFTLIELLVTIALMLSLLVIAIVSFINLSNKKKEEAFNDVKNQVVTAAEQYFSSNAYYLDGIPVGGSVVVNVAELVKTDYLNLITNPTTGQKIDKCYEVKGTKNSDGSVDYEFDATSTECGENAIVAVSEPGAPSISISDVKDIDGKVGKTINGVTWYGNNVIVTATAATEGNGAIAKIENNFGKSISNSNTLESTLSNQGVNKIIFTATNISGKKATVTKEIAIDKKDPSLTVNLYRSITNPENSSDFPLNENYTSNTWYSGYVKTIGNASADSGINYITYQVKYENTNNGMYTFNDNKVNRSTTSRRVVYQGKTTIQYKAVSNTGKAAYSDEYTIKLDRTAPTCTINVSGTAKNENNITMSNYTGWYTSDVSASISTLNAVLEPESSVNVSRSRSPMKSTKLNYDENSAISRINDTSAKILKDTSTAHFSGSIRDDAGNESNCSRSAKRDVTPPTMTTPVKTYLSTKSLEGAYYQHKISLSDNLSGIYKSNDAYEFYYNHCYDNATDDQSSLQCNGFQSSGEYSDATIYTGGYASRSFGDISKPFLQNYTYQYGLGSGYYHLFYKLKDNAGNLSYYRYKLNYKTKENEYSIISIGNSSE